MMHLRNHSNFTVKARKNRSIGFVTQGQFCRRIYVMSLGIDRIDGFSAKHYEAQSLARMVLSMLDEPGLFSVYLRSKVFELAHKLIG